MRTARNSVADTLFSQTRSGVLGLLYGRPDEKFYTRQIARQLAVSVGPVQRELEKLSQAGLILRSAVGNQVFYQANGESPVFPEMRALVAKTIGVFQVLRSALEPVSQQITIAFVYGSIARREESAASDVDLMIIGTATLEDVLLRLSDAEATLGRPVNPTVYSTSEFKSKLATGNHFLNSVIRGSKEFLIGNEDELGKMGRVRVAEKITHQPR